MYAGSRSRERQSRGSPGVATQARWSLLIGLASVACSSNPGPQPGLPTDTSTADAPTHQTDWIPLSEADAKWLGEQADDVAGDKVFFAGDVDGDGRADLLVGARKHDATGSESGIAYLLLGHTPGSRSLAQASAGFAGESAGDYAGGSVATAGDVDGDGFDDILIGAKLQDQGSGIRRGSAYQIRGPIQADVPLSEADARFDGEHADDTAGGTVRGLGDANGDGLDDVVIAAKSSDTSGEDAGAAYIFHGPLSGSYRLGSDAAARLLGDAEGDQAAGTVAAPGDVDGDGLADVVACGCLHDAAGPDAGAVYVVHAPFSGDIPLSAAEAVWLGEQSGDAVGFTAAVGDLTGDGLPDVGVGAPLAGDGGAFYILPGVEIGVASLEMAWSKGVGSPDQQAGASLAGAGDVDGDGQPDLVVGAPGHELARGLVAIFYGPVQGELSLDHADRHLLGEAAGDLAGTEVAGGGDIDGDGLSDLAVGAPGHDESGTDAGAVYILLGSEA